ncbi:MAG: carbon monoxide dehydrogenase, partial [Deltaproteobacteria bacterium]|nr:carbon monoxide dehydrogenase [Deltaproteobacteria bacterium]
MVMTEGDEKAAGLVLAAGASVRMGKPKQLLP